MKVVSWFLMFKAKKTYKEYRLKCQTTLFFWLKQKMNHPALELGALHSQFK